MDDPEVDLKAVEELAKIARNLPMPRLKGRLRVIREHGVVAIVDDNGTVALMVGQEKWNKLGIEAFGE